MYKQFDDWNVVEPSVFRTWPEVADYFDLKYDRIGAGPKTEVRKQTHAAMKHMLRKAFQGWKPVIVVDADDTLSLEFENRGDRCREDELHADMPNTQQIAVYCEGIRKQNRARGIPDADRCVFNAAKAAFSVKEVARIKTRKLPCDAEQLCDCPYWGHEG